MKQYRNCYVANSDGSIMLALDQISKKISVTLRKEQRDAVPSKQLETTPLYRYQQAEGNRCVFWYCRVSLIHYVTSKAPL